ncbi:hypothetical protein WJX72_010877 [[Myrmecia] bisecta]|uniref:Ion transport domain-containing protein n=1 Tax=[Myrmecia] bisecta TaxID=41462 RepID=A0AAW1R909_9CHLO
MRGWFVKKEEPEESLAANWQGEALLARRRQMRMSGDPQVEVQAPTRRSGEEARNISRAPEDAARNTIRATGMSCQGCDTQDNPSASMLTDILAKGMADSPSGEHNLKASSFKQRLGALKTKAYLCMGAAGAAGVKDSDPRLYASRVQQLRARIWRFMNMPDSSALAFLTSLLIMAVIVVSTASFCLETLDHFNNPKAISKFKAVETVCIIIFTLEYLLKLFTAPDLRRFLKQPMNVVDLAAIAPWYLGLILSSSKAAGTRILRVLRLVRIMRIFKLGGRYGKAQVIMRAIVESADVLGIMLFLLSLTVVIFSTLIYYCEKGVYDPALGFQVRAGDKDAAGNPRETPFNSIPASFWWCIVTLMTVGYGDMVPITTAGKVVAGIEMLWCLLCLALPISVIGTNFTQEWLLYQERMKERGSDKEMVPALAQLAELITHHHTNLEDLVKKFTEATIDLDAKCARLKDRIRAQRRDAALQKHNLSTAQTPTSRTSTRRLLRFLRRNFDTEMRELEERMLEQSDWLADLLTINDFFHTDECEDKVKNCR